MPKKPSKSPAGKGPRTPATKPALVAAKRPKVVSNAAPKAASEATQDLSQERIVRALETIAAHLSAQGKPATERESFKQADAYVWHPDGRLAAVPRVSRVELFLLKGVDRMRDILMENTERFANGLPANNALLWGARGMGKSSLVKAAHASINADRKPADKLKLIEIHREDIETLPMLMEKLRDADFHFIVFIDDLSFDGNDASYKSLKAVLEGGIEGRPENVILYATSNRRHLLARDMIENERSTAINPGEAVEEKVSLSDRFGLWLGFHRCSQDEYLAMVRGYCSHFGIRLDEEALEREALEWSTTRGSRSGRVAWQFVQELAGRLGVKLTAK
ncbi:ATP-binding protein [Bradyrhizobium manausense]|uniref:ATP-binding protein n=1 Tax=Bradyrhizobium manausense TaxID=989370 RepID=UPI001BAC82F4|nr:ATP-binding protein [Bradyrhizobium manausense]MBR0688337.1 ATP-binding protein [Bradyrhizobium manausense]